MTKEQAYARYLDLGHAIQSGIAFLMEHRLTLTEPKHLRVGLDMRAVDHGALVSLLIDKGVITEDEYAAKLVEFAEKEVARSEAELSDLTGANVTLG